MPKATKKSSPARGDIEEQVAYIVDYLVSGKLIKEMEFHFPTKTEFQIHEQNEDERYQRIMTVLDAHTKLVTKLDQERLFQIQRIDRLEKELKKIKVHLGLT